MTGVREGFHGESVVGWIIWSWLAGSTRFDLVRAWQRFLCREHRELRPALPYVTAPLDPAIRAETERNPVMEIRAAALAYGFCRQQQPPPNALNRLNDVAWT